MLAITSLYAALLTFVFLALSFRVIVFRRMNRVSLGDGESKDLRQRTRAQANCAEYTPIGLIILACVELQGAPGVAVHALGLMLFLGRLGHAVGLWVHPMIMPLRVGGMILTTLMMAIGAAGLLLHQIF